MPGHDIIVIGASAGGVEALIQLVETLPSDLSAAIFVVLHIAPHATSVLPNILNRYGSLKAFHPQDGEEIQCGQIYVAPPDKHLLLKYGTIRLSSGPKENGHRPAVDPLFRTAARAYGRRVVGAILSGTLDDGTAGLTAVKRLGGVAIAQNPETAMFSGMPKSAIDHVSVDYILPIPDIASILAELAQTPVEEETPEAVPEDMEKESDIAELDVDVVENPNKPGKSSEFACPDCGGVLWELHEGTLLRFRCRVGHAYSADTLLAEQSDALEAALWEALRALEESAALAKRLANRWRERDNSRVAQNFESRAIDAQQRASVIRKVLLKEQIDKQTQ